MNKTIIRIGIGVIVLILIILGIGLFVFRSGTVEQQPDVGSGNGTGSLPGSDVISAGDPSDQGPSIGGVPATDPSFAASVLAEDLKKRSVIAIERLGSYSSDRPLSNYNDVIPMTSANLEVALRNERQEKENAFAASGTYEGYTVIAVTTEASVVDIDGGEVVIDIGALREVTIGPGPTESSNVDYSLTWTLGEDATWRLSGISGTF